MPLYGLAVIFSLWSYPKYFDSPLKYFPILLMYTFLNELLGALIIKYENISLIFGELYYGNSWIIFNIYNFLFFLYFFYVFWSCIYNKMSKKIIKVGALIFGVVSLFNLFVQSFATLPQLYAYIAGGIVLIACVALYMRYLRDTYDHFFLRRDLLSWLGLGMLIFYAGYVPIKILRYYNAIHGLNDAPFVRRVHLSLIIIMYLCFVLGFMFMRRRRKVQEE